MAFILGLQFSENLPPYVRLELEQLIGAIQAQQQTQDEIAAVSSGAPPLEEREAIAVASLDLIQSITAAYDSYIIELLNVRPATNGAKLLFQVSIDRGASFITAASYGWTVNGVALLGTGTTGAESGASSATLTGALSNNANWGISGRLLLTNPLNAALFTSIQGQLLYRDSSGDLRIQALVSGTYRVAAAVNAVRFVMDSGAITSGRIRVYRNTKL